MLNVTINIVFYKKKISAYATLLFNTIFFCFVFYKDKENWF